MSRRGLLAITDAALDTAKRRREGKLGVFHTPASWEAPELPDDVRLNLRGESETIGFYLTSHPLQETALRRELRDGELSGRVNQSRPGVWLTGVGLLSEVWSKPTRRGSHWGGGFIEDLGGRYPVLAFGEQALALAEGLLVQIRGVTDERDGQPALKVTELKILERW